MYPLCPYHDAWKPDRPLDTRVGGAIPGPVLLAHVAACDGDAGVSATTSAKTNRRFRTLPTTCLTRDRDQRYEEVADRVLPVISSDVRRAQPRTIACPSESAVSPSRAAEAACSKS